MPIGIVIDSDRLTVSFRFYLNLHLCSKIYFPMLQLHKEILVDMNYVTMWLNLANTNNRNLKLVHLFLDALKINISYNGNRTVKVVPFPTVLFTLI
jgi:hypothetical protein